MDQDLHVDRDAAARAESASYDADAFLLWAKIGRTRSDTWDRRHPLPCHLIDVGQTTKLLWGEVLRPDPKERIARAIGLGEDTDAAGRWLAFWAAAHDIGKATPGFQSKARDAVEPLRRVGFDFSRCDDHPHAYVSTAVLADALVAAGPARPAVDTRLARRVGIAVGGHHGLFPDPKDWHGLPTANLGCGERWSRVRVALLDRLASIFGIVDGSVPTDPSGSDAHWPMMVLAGLVSVADWIGSNKRYFDHEPKTSDASAYSEIATTRAEEALGQLGWLGWRAGTSTAKGFSELFPFTPRPLQQAAIESDRSLSGSALAIVEAPMGEGKTEAALYLADRWNHQRGGQGLYVAMPTMATGNQMFSRVRGFLTQRYPHDVVNLQLLHSGAMLSEECEQVSKEAEKRRQSFAPDETHDAVESRCGAVVAESWFAQNGKQAILAPFGVGTIDQALLSVLQVRHGFVRLFGLAGKAVILDEVHAYDAYMSTLMTRLLEWLSALGCTVILLSATLPSDKMRELLKAWTGTDPSLDPPAYPRLTVAVDGKVTSQNFATTPERRKTITLEWRAETDLAGDLRSALDAGGCAAVIRNTVGQAQETYLALRDQLSPHGVEVMLFHARFPFYDRQRIEREVLSRFGDLGSDERPNRAVLVATQVIEQSLDLDFGLMVSDLAPADLVLQRAGRLHRHERDGRPIQQPTLWLLKPAGFEGVPEFGNGHDHIYDRYILLRSFLALRDRDAVNLPDDIEHLVAAVYEDEDPVASLAPAWTLALTESREAMLGERMQDAQAARRFCIDTPFADELFVMNQRDLDDENPERPPEQKAATRLASPSVRVVFLERGTPWATRTSAPSIDEARGLLGQAVGLQNRRLVGPLLGLPVPPSWRQSAFLRFHRLVELDADGSCRIGDVGLHVRRDLGVWIGDRPPERRTA